MTTKSTKLNTIIAQAEQLGLQVKIETENTMSTTLDSISLRISLNFNGHANLLESILTHEFITIHALRYTGDNKPRAYKLSARKYNILGEPTVIIPTRIEHWLNMMADDLHRYQTNQAA